MDQNLLFLMPIKSYWFEEGATTVSTSRFCPFELHYQKLQGKQRFKQLGELLDMIFVLENIT